VALRSAEDAHRGAEVVRCFDGLEEGGAASFIASVSSHFGGVCRWLPHSLVYFSFLCVYLLCYFS
jgi:hypothetical protein